MTNNFILLQEIEFYYNKNKKIFDKFNLTIQNNQKIAIMGINGSGKTTLLKLLNGLIFPQKGKYYFLEKEINKNNLKDKQFHLWFRKNCVMLFQNSDFMFFHSSVYDDLAFSLRLQSLEEDKIKEKIYYWSEIFKITHLLRENPIHLSGGERKKIALAMMFILEPEIILLDEPFNHLDPIYTGHLIEIINSFDKTILFTSHNLDLTLEITKKILILHPLHQILYFGNIDNFFNDQELIEKSELYHIHSHKHKNKIHRHYHIHNWNF